jgi:hypothetical protein
MSAPLPYTLDGGHEAKFYVIKAEMDHGISTNGYTGTSVRPFVDTSVHGKVLGKAFVPVPQPA